MPAVEYLNQEFLWATQKEAEAWQQLRPADVSADKWSERLGLCKEASIEMQQLRLTVDEDDQSGFGKGAG